MLKIVELCDEFPECDSIAHNRVEKEMIDYV